MTNNLGTFRCSLCQTDYKKRRTDEEAIQASKFILGRNLKDDEKLKVVCESCLTEALAWHGMRVGRA